MNPKPAEKAKELVMKFRYLNINLLWYDCKQCAIILCNEIIKNNTHIAVISKYSSDLICSTQYWKKVIEIIKTL